MNCDKAADFIKRNARPLDKAIYRYFFEKQGSKNVIQELIKYQNADGGFGHGLEADNWNPNSNPIATNDAIITLYRINALKEADNIVSGIVKYLNSHDSFDEEQKRWLFSIDSNVKYPHAIWWEKRDSGIMGYNPTVSLAAFMLCFSEKSSLYEDIIRCAFDYLEENENVSGDELKCYMLCYELLSSEGITDIVSLPDVKPLIQARLEKAICKEIDKYGVEYVPVPSDFFTGCYSEFINDDIKKLIKAEIDILGNIQNDDGGFDITWQWHTPYAEFEQARAWWRPRITIDKLLYYRNFAQQEFQCKK